MCPWISDTLRCPSGLRSVGRAVIGAQSQAAPPARVPELKRGTAGTTPGPGGPQSRGVALLGATLDLEGLQGVGDPCRSQAHGRDSRSLHTTPEVLG